MTKEFKIVKETLVYQDPYTKFYNLDVAKDGVVDKYPHPRLVRSPFAMIIPLSEKGRVLLIRQMRAAVYTNAWEFPAGGIDTGEVPDVAAVRELWEEVGLKPVKSVEKIGFVQPNQTAIDNPGTIYVTHVNDADFAHVQSQDGSDDPITDMHAVTLAEFGSMMDNGEITCGVTIAAYGYLRRYLDRNP